MPPSIFCCSSLVCNGFSALLINGVKRLNAFAAESVAALKSSMGLGVFASSVQALIFSTLAAAYIAEVLE